MFPTVSQDLQTRGAGLLVLPGNHGSCYFATMARKPPQELVFRAAQGDERIAAVGLLCDQANAADREAQAKNLLASLPRADVLIASRGERIVAATLTQAMPGHGGLVWPPRALEDEPVSTRVSLLRWATSHLAQQAAHSAQALTYADAEQDAEVFFEAGYTRLSELLYLMSELDDFPDAEPAGDLRFEPYQEQARERLANLIAATYEGTLDCPQLNNARDMDDVVDSYQGTGSFDPLRWQIVCEGGQDIGCLLLTEHAHHDLWELVYMGLIPAAHRPRTRC